MDNLSGDNLAVSFVWILVEVFRNISRCRRIIWTRWRNWSWGL